MNIERWAFANRVIELTADGHLTNLGRELMADPLSCDPRLNLDELLLDLKWLASFGMCLASV